MATSRMIMTLGKVIVAAAWADGKVSNDEINSLKDLLFHLPDLNAREWAELEMYIDAPVNEAERARLIDELEAQLSSAQDKQFAIRTLNEVVGADGVITDEEQRVIEEISAAIEAADTSVMGAFSRLFRGPIQRRSEHARQAPNRERFFYDYLNNRVYYSIQRQLELGEFELDLPEDHLRKLSMAGGLMGQVARVNKEIDEGELRVIMEALEHNWGLSAQQAAFVAGISVDETSAHLDQYRLAREFVAVCSRDELLHFVDALFELAAADGWVSVDEIEEIRMIARSLLLSHEEFIAAKVKIPRDKREA